MQAFHQDKLLPAIISNRRQDQHKIMIPEFEGSININPLRLMPKNLLDLKLDELVEPKNGKNKKVFSSYKQEQHYRLNRENKLKVNEEITNYIKNTKNRNENVDKKFNVKSEKDQIRDAVKQMDEINYILEHNKKNLSKKNDPIRNKFDGMSFLNERVSKRLPSESNLKHMCTKGLRNKINHYNATNSDKKLRQNDNQNEKGHTPSQDVLNPTYLLNKITNQRNKKSIKNAIDALNIRLTNSRQKILQDYEETMRKSKEKLGEIESLQRKRTPKYKSIKDVKLDEEKLKEFENEIKVKKKLSDDPKEMKVLYKNEIFQSEIENKTSEIQFDKNDLPEKYKKFLIPDKELEDLKVSSDLGDVPVKKEALFIKKSPRQCLVSLELEKNLQKVQDLKLKSQKDPILLPTSHKKTSDLNDQESNSKGVGNELESNDLEKSILQSNYLTKEFHMDMGNSGSNKDDNIVNWADKFKVEHPQKWSKDFEYFLT